MYGSDLDPEDKNMDDMGVNGLDECFHVLG